jgi:preprotein translocase subunit SecB
MTETNGSAAPEAPAQIRMQVLAQYIRDLSFENVVAQKGDRKSTRLNSSHLQTI